MIFVGDKGWMAAIIDAKGRVVTKSNRRRATPQYVLEVASKDDRITTRLGALTGTSPEANSITQFIDFNRRGCAVHCTDAHIHVEWNDSEPVTITKWTISGAAMAVVLLALQPYLVTWDDYVPYVTRILETMTLTGQGSGATRAAILRLHGLGWPVPPDILATVTARQKAIAK
jgi:hypothetical protein